ncbi:MAG: hypothetical protein C0415_00850 [Thermodesulfovibrio sp.]|nr:hypothetical protein [Thermodesulfovibrio sp.]
MTTKNFFCVDCVENLQKVSVKNLSIFYCNNVKCRRFGVLTLGGLEDAKCEKRIIIEYKEDTGVDKPFKK